MFQGFDFVLQLRVCVSGPGVGQYRVNKDGTASAYSLGRASQEMLQDIEQQVEEASSTASFRSRFRPVWKRQRIFVAIPTQQDPPTKEWRLCSRIISIGELMLVLGYKYSAHDIELFWRSMAWLPRSFKSMSFEARKGELRINSLLVSAFESYTF